MTCVILNKLLRFIYNVPKLFISEEKHTICYYAACNNNNINSD